MNTKEKAPTSAATLTEAAETGTACRSVTTSNDKCIGKGAGGQDKIAGLLLAGAENGILLRDLSQIVGADPRIVRQMIHNERRQGTPILSNSKDGYYLPACEDEKEACVRQMRGRAREILAAAAGIERGGR